MTQIAPHTHSEGHHRLDYHVDLQSNGVYFGGGSLGGGSITSGAKPTRAIALAPDGITTTSSTPWASQSGFNSSQVTGMGPGTPTHTGSSGYGTGSVTSISDTNGTSEITSGLLGLNTSASIGSYTTGTVTTTGTSGAAARATVPAQNVAVQSAGGGTIGGGAPQIAYTFPGATANTGVPTPMLSSVTGQTPGKGMLSEKAQLQEKEQLQNDEQATSDTSVLSILAARNTVMDGKAKPSQGQGVQTTAEPDGGPLQQGAIGALREHMKFKAYRIVANEHMAASNAYAAAFYAQSNPTLSQSYKNMINNNRSYIA